MLSTEKVTLEKKQSLYSSVTNYKIMQSKIQFPEESLF